MEKPQYTIMKTKTVWSEAKSPKTFISQSLSDTKKCAEKFLAQISCGIYEHGNTGGATVVALKGDLGAGKTAFVKQAARVLGIREMVSSPTFVLERIYKIPRDGNVFLRMVHIDAYRIENAKDLLVLGWNEILKDPKTIVFLEWPERVSAVLPSNTKTIYFRIFDEKTRSIDFL